MPIAQEMERPHQNVVVSVERLRGKSRKEAPTDLINVITLRYYLTS